MAIYLVYRTNEADRRADGRHTFLVDAANAAAARTAAGVPGTWAAFELALAGQLPASPTTGATERLSDRGRRDRRDGRGPGRKPRVRQSSETPDVRSEGHTRPTTQGSTTKSRNT